MPEETGPAGTPSGEGPPGRRRFWARFLGQDPDLRLETRWQKVLAFFGIHVPPPGRRDRLHIRPRFFKVLGVLAIALPLVLLGAAYKVSTSPLLCNQCHIMKPYYQAWKTSKHNFVPCVDCHYPPGFRDTLWVKYQALAQVAKWATQTYSSKPFAEIEDASCLRSQCHSTRLLEGRVTFKRGILFDHRPHLEERRRGRQLRCTSCHSQIVVGTHIEVTEGTCFLCHFKGTKKGRELSPIGGCPSCHLPPKGDIRLAGGVVFNHKEFVDEKGTSCLKCHFDAIQGEGEAPRERCFTCHNQPEKLAKYEDHPFIHENHVARHNIECARCHTEIKHQIRTQAPTVSPAPECSVCHEAKHQGQQAMYLGIGGKGSPPIPSHMYTARVQCIACHVVPKDVPAHAAEFTGQTFRASEAACVGCHGSLYWGMLEAWKQTLDTMLAEVRPKLDAARKAVGESQGAPGYPDAARLLRDAAHNVDFVTFGKGVHNVFYAADLLKVANEGLNEAIRLAGKPPVKAPKEDLVRGGYCATLCHSQAGVILKPEVRFEKRAPLPHQKHFTEFGAVCTSCHSAEKHKAVTITQEGCRACHHSPQTERCTACHRPQNDLYAGTVQMALDVKQTSNVMAGKVECTGCHTWQGKHSAEAVAATCANCHDKAYADMLAMWQEQVKGAHDGARAALERAEAALVAARKAKRDLGQAAPLVAAARKDYDVVSRAKGAHNPDLAEAVFTKVKETAEKALSALSR